MLKNSWIKPSIRKFQSICNKMASENSELQWKTLFDNMQAKSEAAMSKKSKQAKASGDNELGDTPMVTDGGGNKRLSVERIYQKKTQLEHILLRPDTYIGSVESVTQAMWVMDTEANKMVQKEITYVPGLYKIFDEIMVNAADNKQRDPKMDCLKIDIDPETCKIKIWNNGKGIPVVEHKSEKMYVPTMIFGHLLTSSNYDDTEKKVTGGRNGYGAKLCNIFSTKFIVETSAKEYKRAFKQTWTDNMSKTKEPTITDSKENDFTCVTFFPDLSKFKMESLDADIVSLLTRRAYDIASSTIGIKVYLNGKRLPIKGFRDYIDLFVKDKTDDAGAPLKIIYERINDRWEVGVTQSEKGFQQVSFVNSIATTKGGRHVDYIADQCVTKLIDVVRKKNKGGVNIKPFQVKNHLWVFVNCLIENPTFDSQTKENMTKQAKGFGSKCVLGEKFITQVSKGGIVESILSWMKFKAQSQLNKKCHASKHSKLKGIPKLDDANDAGTRNSSQCTLILTEGDSAKTLAVAGLGVIGRDRYGVFPLRGKLLNVREATHKQIMENAEINNIIKIIGLHFKENYDDPTKLSQLRYGKLMIMTDQDQDGSHIKGLLINFVHHFWPSLLRHNFVEEFITPIVKVVKGKIDKAFYSMPEFEEWKAETENWHTYKVKYYKGLGTSTSKEAKEYFQDMPRHRIPFHYSGGEDDSSINLAFSKKKCEERKEWLTNHMEEKKQRLEMGLPELYLYGKETRSISFSDFVNRELILFSNADIIRSIPGVMDGFKPGQRKVMFTCIKRNLVTKELKVAQLAGSVAEQSAYHHGENSLMGTIINLAQDYVGSNNLNMLQPLGQFGTRIHGGKDAASPRYIFTMLSPLARHVFNANDDALLNHLYDDNQKIEPEWYCPILPMVLVNGAEGIGTGWSTKIPNYDVRTIVDNIKRMLNGLEPLPMIPSFKNFKGLIEEIPGDNRYSVHGEIAILDDQTVEITELPIRTWTQNYKEDVLEVMLHGTEKTPSVITDYKEYNTDTTIKFVVKMSADKLAQAEQDGLHKFFKLASTISINSMVLFNSDGCIRRYEKVEEILKEFYSKRLDFYKQRKDFMEGALAAESLKMDNIARFIMEKIDGTIVIENKPKKELIQMLVRRGYDSDPIKAWKESQNKKDEALDDDDEEDSSGSGPDFNYLLGMPLWNLTKEKKDELIKQKEAKAAELKALRKKTPMGMWHEDLDAFLVALTELEKKEKELPPDVKPQKLGKLGKTKPRKAVLDIMPSPMGRRVVPTTTFAVNKSKGEAKKVPKVKLEQIKAETNDDADDDGNQSNQSTMLDFIKTEGKVAGAASRGGRGGGAKGRGRGKAAATGTVREKKVGGSPSKKKGKKKNPWSSEESASDGNMSDDHDSDAEQVVVIPRETVSRRAASSNVNYSFENEEEVQSEGSDNEQEFKAFDAETGQYVANGDSKDDGSDFVVASDDEVAAAPSPPPPKKAKPQPKKLPATKKVPAAKPPAKKAAPKKKAAVLSDLSSDDDEEVMHSKAILSNKELYPSSDDEDITDEPKPVKKPAASKPKKAPAPKKAVAFISSDDDSPVKKASPAKKAPAKKRKNDSDEESFATKKKAPVTKKRAKNDAESDGDSSFDTVHARATTGRSRATVKYNFSSEDEDFE